TPGSAPSRPPTEAPQPSPPDPDHPPEGPRPTQNVDKPDESPAGPTRPQSDTPKRRSTERSETISQIQAVDSGSGVAIRLDRAAAASGDQSRTAALSFSWHQRTVVLLTLHTAGFPRGP